MVVYGDASLEADVVNVAAAIMKLGDRYQINASLGLTEMKAFLAGTVYHEFCDWLSESSVFARFDANRDEMLDLPELQDAVREYLGGEPVYQSSPAQSVEFDQQQPEQHDEVHEALLNHSTALGNIFDAHSRIGQMSADDFDAFATDYELSPALMSLGAVRSLFAERAGTADATVGYGEFAQLVAECSLEAFPGQGEHSEVSSEERVAALMVYMGQQPNHMPVTEPEHHSPTYAQEDRILSSPNGAPQAEVGLWQIANQIHCSIHDLDDNSASKQALSVPSSQLKQVPDWRISHR